MAATGVELLKIGVGDAKQASNKGGVPGAGLERIYSEGGAGDKENRGLLRNRVIHGKPGQVARDPHPIARKNRRVLGTPVIGGSARDGKTGLINVTVKNAALAS